TLLADDDAGTRGLDGDVHLLRGALDGHAADRSILQARRQELAHAEIRVHVRGELLLVGIPLRHPVTGDAKANAIRVNFLTHASILLTVAHGDSDVTVALHDARAAALGAGGKALEDRSGVHVDTRDLEIVDI